MRLYILIGLLVASTCMHAIAQGYLAMSGRVIDKITKKPIAGAYVGLMSKGTGTLTNEDGQFLYRFPRISVDSAMVVAVLGYQTFYQKASTFTNLKDITIALESSQTTVVDSGFIKSFEARNLVAEALTKIKKNNPTNPYLLNGFYRETLQQDSMYVEIREAVLQAEKDPRPKILIPEKVKSLKNRSFLGQDKSKIMEGYAFPNGATIVTHSIEIGVPEYLDGKNLYDYKYELDDSLTTYLDKKVYQIRFSPVTPSIKAARNGIISISATDSAIVKIEYDFTPEGVKDVLKTSTMDKFFGKTKRNPKSLSTTIHYKPYAGKWYLQDYKMALATDFEQNKTKFIGTIQVQFVSTEILKSNGTRIAETDVLIDTENFMRQSVPKYDEVYWGNFNFVFPSASMRQIINNLAK